ncbi:cytochrome P450 3A41-like [Pomacea canaliculata]|uniref:cytochrome P450 3A41-like n=1 Tax=Pomacea canaliculata TaxID=400727 RepID=UPI000D73803F|nr:cytochrome P450 3A41-like [Pomacea canaliculata]
MYLTLVIVLFALLLFYRYLKENYKLFIKDGVDGPTPVYIFGNLGEFAGKDPLEKFTELTNRFGKVFGFYQGLTPSIVVSDPDLIQQILVKNFSKFNGRPRFLPFLHFEEKEILQNVCGSKWKNMREAMASAFNNTNIQKVFPRLLHVADQFVDELQRLVLKHPQGFDIQKLNECYALDSVAFTALGLETKAIAHGEECMMLQYVYAYDNSASPENAASGLARAYQCLEVLKIVDIKHKRLAKEYFDCLSHHMESERQKVNTSARPKSMLQHLLTYNPTSRDHATNPARSPLTTSEILGLTSSMVGGGVGSTASALDFTLHCLAVHPRHQEKLRQEVLNVCGVEGNFTIEQVREIDYLDQVINESLRFYPIAPGVARTCSEDCVVNGVQFRAGTEVRLMGITQYKDPEIFPDPLTFKPERFSKEEKSRHPGSWFPFGAGPRMCVGMHLAQLHLKVAIIKLLQNFEISTSDLTQDPLPVTLRPHLSPRNGVHIRLTRIAR